MYLTTVRLRFFLNKSETVRKLSFGNENNQLSENLMSIDELKAELDLRGVDFTDCFSKSELVTRLIETRASGKANPDILDKFNSALKVASYQNFKFLVFTFTINRTKR